MGTENEIIPGGKERTCKCMKLETIMCLMCLGNYQ